MQKHDFPDIAKHRELHVRFFEGLDQLMEDLRVFGPTQHIAEQAWEMAQDSLIDHIADEDTLYVKYVRND